MSSEWRNVRVKEEPVSDFEDGRGVSSRSASRHSRSDRDRGDRREGGERRDRRDRYSPSPPPSHSKHRGSSSQGRPGSYDGDRDRNRRREPPREDRDRRRELSRERRRDLERPDLRHVKKEEPRSRSRSRSPPQHDRRRGGNMPEREDRRERDRGQSSREPRDRPRDGAREQDWNNFFNPNSDMSRQANVKREKEEEERKEVLNEFGKKEEDSGEQKEKEQPNFGLSGKLTEETNTFRGVVVKYSEPPEARKPNKIRWRLYPFKGQEALPVMYVHRQSAYLLGRDRKVADIPVDHPSCSKQHAVLQYRLVPYTRADGSKGRRIKPYLLDLESANGTYVNGNKIDPKRYVELFEKDVLKFGFSSREYVLLHEQSKDIEDESAGELTPD